MLPTLLLMLAAGVVVPLGIEVVVREDEAPLWLLLLPFSAIAGVVTWAFPPGTPWAIALASVHALTCIAIGVAGVGRLFALVRGGLARRLPEALAAYGMALLPVGGVWLMAARMGLPLLGFEEPIVTFTAAHFHFAGFGAPVVLGMAGERVFVGRPPTRLYRIAAVAVGAGIPLTALGIATSHLVERLAACTLAAGMVAAAAFLLTAARRRAPTELGALLFGLSGATLLLTMALAAVFALGSSAGRGSTFEGLVSLATMVDFHGAANAIGFVLAGLLALRLTPRT